MLYPIKDQFTNNLNIYEFLIKYNYYVYKILCDKDNNIIVNVDNNNYIMIETDNYKYKINLSDIMNNNIYYGKGMCNWYDLWIAKVDYYEYQIDQVKRKYPLLYNTFAYYSGLTENAIELILNVNYEIDYYISHKRIGKNELNIDFYNPINLILDSKVRDVCEYFKSCFFYEENPIISIKNYIDYNLINDTDAILFLSRMIYPSYYFDLYDKILKGEQKEDKILDITKKVDDYEQLLIEVYNYIIIRFNVPEIEWIKKI